MSQPTGLFSQVASSVEVLNVPKGRDSEETEKHLLLNLQGGKISPQFYFILPSVTYNSKIRVTEKKEEEERIIETGN
jgi:hypothetical protein